MTYKSLLYVLFHLITAHAYNVCIEQKHTYTATVFMLWLTVKKHIKQVLTPFQL